MRDVSDRINKVDEKVDAVSEKIDKLGDKIASIDKTLGEQHVVLKEHIRRTELLEAKVEPMEKKMIFMDGSMKMVVGVGSIIGVMAGIAEILMYLKGMH